MIRTYPRHAIAVANDAEAEVKPGDRVCHRDQIGSTAGIAIAVLPWGAEITVLWAKPPKVMVINPFTSAALQLMKQQAAAQQQNVYQVSAQAALNQQMNQMMLQQQLSQQSLNSRINWNHQASLQQNAYGRQVIVLSGSF